LVSDRQARVEAAAKRGVPDFTAEVATFNAWLSYLGESEGVQIVSDSRVRILRIVDRAKFGAALEALEAMHDWPASYRAANVQRWWSADQVAATAPFIDITFSNTAQALVVRAVKVTPAADGGLEVGFWVEDKTPGGLTAGWRLFAHVVDASGAILANAEAAFISDAPSDPNKTLRYYRVLYTNRPQGATGISFGLFKPAEGGLEFLTADQGTRDMDARRVIVPLP